MSDRPGPFDPADDASADDQTARRLREVLAREARAITPSADGLAMIREKIRAQRPTRRNWVRAFQIGGAGLATAAVAIIGVDRGAAQVRFDQPPRRCHCRRIVGVPLADGADRAASHSRRFVRARVVGAEQLPGVDLLRRQAQGPTAAAVPRAGDLAGVAAAHLRQGRGQRHARDSSRRIPTTPATGRPARRCCRPTSWTARPPS